MQLVYWNQEVNKMIEFKKHISVDTRVVLTSSGFNSTRNLTIGGCRMLD